MQLHGMLGQTNLSTALVSRSAIAQGACCLKCRMAVTAFFWLQICFPDSCREAQSSVELGSESMSSA